MVLVQGLDGPLGDMLSVLWLHDHSWPCCGTLMLAIGTAHEQQCARIASSWPAEQGPHVNLWADTLPAWRKPCPWQQPE